MDGFKETDFQKQRTNHASQVAGFVAESQLIGESLLRAGFLATPIFIAGGLKALNIPVNILDLVDVQEIQDDSNEPNN